jgi:cytochrome oxidase Cu insertion factor (SCO1/SenC/PrrC family)
MTRSHILMRLGVVVVGLLAIGLLADRLLLTPTHGTLLLLLSARQPDHIGTMPVEAHSASGWWSLGSLQAVAVPKAPATATAIQTSAPTGDYDAIGLGGQVLPARFTVQRDLLATVLVSVAGGRPVANGVYAGGEAVSLGLDELAGQVRPLPAFTLTDQFGRPFDNASVAGHDVVLAAFHTTCRESCPLYTGLFMQLRKQLPPDVLLIEVTTDPQEDSPDALREYAGRVGASWTFLTGDPTALAGFWTPFNVDLSNGNAHASTLALIDAHGYIRSFWQGAPDVGGSLPQALQAQLNYQGEQLLRSRGNGWGQAQVLDSLRVVAGLSQPSSTGQGRAADFSLTSLDGRQVSLHQLIGRPVLVNFWATWCAPCRREVPLIEQTAAKHQTVAVLLVDERDSRESARGFANELHARSTVLFDGDGAVGDRYGISGLPTTFFIRADGTVEGRYVGETNRQVLESHIDAIGG